MQPFRLRLRGGKELDGRVAGRKIDFVLPPGETLQFRLASSLSPDDLDLLGVWRNLPASLSGDVEVKRAAADGLLWGLTPYEDVKLVHAVERPLMVPRAVRVVASRPLPGDTHVILLGAVELHGPSTDSLAAEGSWEDSVDDLSRDEWHLSPRSELGFQTRIRPYEDLALLSSVDAELVLPQLGKVSVHNARHELHDTRHRVVRYRFRASTRYREYFAPALLKPDPDDPRDDGVSVIGPEIEVRVPSSARPAAPIVHSVIPLFRWSRTREPDQPMARRHVRRSGVRIYLDRPWFSSGNDELLGILLAPGGDDEFGPPPEDQSGFPFVSKWGGDPLWLAPHVANRGLPSLVLSNLLHAGGFDDRDVVARPVTGAQTLPLAALEGGHDGDRARLSPAVQQRRASSGTSMSPSTRAMPSGPSCAWRYAGTSRTASRGTTCRRPCSATSSSCPRSGRPASAARMTVTSASSCQDPSVTGLHRRCTRLRCRKPIR